MAVMTLRLRRGSKQAVLGTSHASRETEYSPSASTVPELLEKK